VICNAALRIVASENELYVQAEVFFELLEFLPFERCCWYEGEDPKAAADRKEEADS